MQAEVHPNAGAGMAARYELDPLSTLELQLSLVDKSLVASVNPAGKARYLLLETLRQYARDRLYESGESEIVRKRHAEYYLTFVEQADAKLKGAEQAVWLQRLEEEHENLRAALSWSLDTTNPVGTSATEDLVTLKSSLEPRSNAAQRFCGSLFIFWDIRGHLSEGLAWCKQALKAAQGQGQTRERANVLAADGNLAKSLGDTSSARLYHEESLELHLALGNKKGVAEQLGSLGTIAKDHGDYATALQKYNESLVISQEAGDRVGSAATYNNMGIVAFNQGDYSNAKIYYEESKARFQESGNQERVAYPLLNLGGLAFCQGDYAEATRCYDAALSIQRVAQNRMGIAHSLMNLGNIAAVQGEYAEAQSHHEECLSIMKDIGDRGGIASSLTNLGEDAFDRGDYSSARTYHQESLSIFSEINDRRGLAFTLEGLASDCAKENAPQQSAVIWGAASALREEIGSPLTAAEQEVHDRKVEDVRLSLGEELFIASWQQGRDMPLEEAIAFAVDGPTST